MSQTFNVVRCFQCSIYQVDIDKKSTKKWTCKLCGAKQTLKQIFFQGDSKDCRTRVQALNENKIKTNESIGEQKLLRIEQLTAAAAEHFDQRDVVHPQPSGPKVSRWAKYLTNDDDDNDDGFNE